MRRFTFFSLAVASACLICYSPASGTCFPPNDQKKLDSIHDADDRFEMLAGIAKRQASRLRSHLNRYRAPSVWDERRHPTGGDHGSGREILDVQACAISQLLEELSGWRPASDRDVKMLQEVLHVTKRVDDTLVELGSEVESDLQPTVKKNLDAVLNLETKIGDLCKSCRLK